MAYKVGGSEKIKDDNTVTFKNVTVKNRYTFYEFQGETSGYHSGGEYNPPATPPYGVVIDTRIDKFPFSSDANATNVGDLSQARRRGTAGHSSGSNGYTAGGWQPPLVGPYAILRTIDKFPFSSHGTATDVGDLTDEIYSASGQSSDASGYTSGGYPDLPSTPPTTATNVIAKFPFTSDANATDVGDLTQGRADLTGHSSSTHGYNSGGFSSPPYFGSNKNTIDKFPFASNANATDVGDLTHSQSSMSGQSSTTDGYASGGAPYYSSKILKFSFSSDGNATDVGLLIAGYVDVAYSAGQSSTTHGYSSGGIKSPPYEAGLTDIFKFPYAISSGNATDIADLTLGREFGAGQQV